MREYVFLSYRRSDSAGVAGRIRDRLERTFGPDSVFMDVADIDPAEVFGPKLVRKIQGAAATLVLIGPGWLAASAKDRRRLDDPKDYTRREIETALASHSKVLPVLLEGAAMPAPEELPESLRPLTTFNAAELRSGVSFEDDVRRLAAAVADLAPDLRPQPATAPQSGNKLGYAALAAGVVLTSVLAAGWLASRTERQQVAAVEPAPIPQTSQIPPAEPPPRPKPQVETPVEPAPQPRPRDDKESRARDDEARAGEASATREAAASPPRAARGVDPQFTLDNARLISLQTYNNGNVSAQITFNLSVRNPSDREIFVAPSLASTPVVVVLESGATFSSRVASSEFNVPRCRREVCLPADQTAIAPGETLKIGIRLGGNIALSEYEDREAIRSGTFTGRFFVTDREGFETIVTANLADIAVNPQGFRP